MKDLNDAFNDIPEETSTTIKLNKEHLLKYLCMFAVVSVASLVIPTCGVLKSQAVMIGLLAATTFVVIDVNFPNHVFINEFHN